MKTRFNTFDIICVVAELQKYVGMRVNNIYDIDNKTYLLKLHRSEEKGVILLESGNRIHSTAFEWPKNVAPSGFSMKMRKHLKNKRLESLTQLGTDRIVDLQFGSGEAAYHVILELYDKGNIILTDFELTILYILRPHTEGESVRFAVKEKYPHDRAKENTKMTKEKLITLLENAKQGDQLKKVLVFNLDYGPAIIEHVLLQQNFNSNAKIGKTFDIKSDIDNLMLALDAAEIIFEEGKKGSSKGYIIQKQEEKISTEPSAEKEYFYSNQEFHPRLFAQHVSSPHKEFDSFNAAIDEFFSSVESQKIELRAIQQEKQAFKKLENVKNDHKQRLETLEKTQELDKMKAELIMRNQEVVDKAILIIQSLLANQLPWDEIENLIKDATEKGDPIAQLIKKLKLETNHISLYLTDPYAIDQDDSDVENDNDDKLPSMVIDMDLGLKAFANATRYYDQKKHAAKKQQKTIESQGKALKSAEKKTMQTLKEMKTITNIHKARKLFWFEKFFWFVSSENYLVIAGRDQQQNEFIVKRYMKPTDIYVHADIHGASSVVIKNPTGKEVPPKTLNEAGIMAICYSVAWEAKVVTNAYWVWGEQVSKTAPTGEYLTTGSFMVRGKKNFLPTSHLVLGLSFLFRLEDGFVEKHKGERKVVQGNEDDLISLNSDQNKDEEEIDIVDESEEDDETNSNVKTENDNIIKEEDSDSASENEESAFPDTKIKIQHFSGTKMNILTESNLSKDDEIPDENVVFLGDDKPVIIKNVQRNRGDSLSSNKSKKVTIEENDNTNKSKSQLPAVKRGQKSKLKKIKEKYKDQDDEERQLRMGILQSAGPIKETKKSKKKREEKEKQESRKNRPKIMREQKIKNNIDDEGIDDDEPIVQADVDMIDALTGIPEPDDELLFAVPVIAPYNTLANYKFKVKLTPGTGKKGKAAKTAVAIFLKDRTITPREKDLLKAVKDDQMARNFPGKVKLSAPKLQSVKK